MIMHNLADSRRRWLTQMLFSGGLLGLRMAASGLPRAALANPDRYLASLTDERVEAQLAARTSSATPQFLVMSASDAGEPANCNVPGMYLGQGFYHPTAPSMAQTSFALGGQEVIAAQAWANLGTSNLARTCFFHHATTLFAHGGIGSAHTLNGAVTGNEMMVSAFAKALSGPLATIQQQPISIANQGGTELLKFGGNQQPAFSPTSIRDLLTTPAALAAFSKTQALRDRDLDALNALLKRKSGTAQAALIDSMVTSQAQARSLSATLIGQLHTIADNTPASQAVAAALLCQLKLTPAVVVHIPFGGDNHTDTDPHQGPGLLPAEASQHVSGVAAINSFVQTLAAAGIQDNATYASLTTFGRSNTDKSLSGRAHNGLHSCNVIIGKNVRASVVGGAKLQTSSNSPIALAIDPATGTGGDGGSIAYADTLTAYGMTLGAACGLSTATLSNMISNGTIVAAALA